MENWQREQMLQSRWDGYLRRRPICADCGERITSSLCLPLDDGSCLCPRCVRERMRPAVECA